MSCFNGRKIFQDRFSCGLIFRMISKLTRSYNKSVERNSDEKALIQRIATVKRRALYSRIIRSIIDLCSKNLNILNFQIFQIQILSDFVFEFLTLRIFTFSSNSWTSRTF